MIDVLETQMFECDWCYTAIYCGDMAVKHKKSVYCSFRHGELDRANDKRIEQKLNQS